MPNDKICRKIAETADSREPARGSQGRKCDIFDICPIQSVTDPAKLAAWFSCPPPRQSRKMCCLAGRLRLKARLQRKGPMAHNFAINHDVHHQLQGPQGRAVIKQTRVYTNVTCLPIEADGRPRYRIKSKTENIERVVTEEQISRLS